MQNTTNTQSVISDFSHSPQALLRQVPVGAVQLTDTFWQPRRSANVSTTLPSQYRHLEETGAIDNFRRAAGAKDVPFSGWVFSELGCV